MFQNLLNSIKTLLGGQNPNSPTVQAQQQFAPPQQIQGQNAPQNSLLQAGNTAQQYVEQHATNPVPNFFQPDMKDPLLMQIAKGIGNIVPSTINSLFGKQMLAPGVDAVHYLQQGGKVDFNKLVSPQFRFGTDIQGGATPQQTLSDAAGSVEPIATDLTLGTQPQQAVQNFKDPTLNLFTKIMQGVATGGKIGGGFGALSGLEQGANAKSLQDDLLNTVAQMGIGGATGAVVGGATAGIGGALNNLTHKGEPTPGVSEEDNSLMDIMNKVKAGQELSPEEKTTFAQTPMAKWQELDTGKPQAQEITDTHNAVNQIPNNMSTIMRNIKTDTVPMDTMEEEMPIDKSLSPDKSLIDEYGTTNDPKLGAYITNDGKMIDGSGARQGNQSPTQRVVDHREIATTAFPNESGQGAMRELQNTGIVRMGVYNDEVNFDIVHMPTAQQIAQMKKISQGRTIQADITDPDGYVAKSGVFNTFDKYVSFLNNHFSSEQRIKSDISAGNIPQELQPMAALAQKAKSFKDLQSMITSDAMNKAMGVANFGNKMWGDYGFEGMEDFYNKVKNTLDSEKGGIDFGANIGNGKTNDFAQQMDNLSNKTPEELAAMNQGTQANAGALNPENAETNQQMQAQQPPEQPGNPGQPAFNPKDVAQQARMERSGINQSINFRAANLADQMQRVLKTPQDNLNFRLALEDPSKLDDYAEQSSNPTVFKQLAGKYSDFTDFVFSKAQDNKVDMNNVQDYFTHIWDLSTPEAQQKYQDLMASIKNYQSGFTKERFIDTIKQGLAAGLTLKNDNAADDVLQYAQSMGKQISASAFNSKINELRPNGAVPIENGGAYNYQGQPFEQSNVPGNKGTLIDPEINRYMHFYDQNNLTDNPWVNAYDQLNKGLKEVKLSGGLFHALRETVNYAGSMAATGHAPDLPTGARVFVDPGFANDTFQNFIDDGTLDSLSKNGVQLSNASGIGDENSNPLTMLQSHDPIKKATFQRLINYYIMDTWNKLPDDQKTPQMGAQIQAMYSGVNQEVAGNSKALNMVLRNVFLAPQFNIGKLINIKAALTPSLAPQNNFARAAIAGTVVSTAVEYELANFAMNHKLDGNLTSVLMNGVLHPAVSLPYKSPSGKGLQADLPSSDVGDLWKTITNPLHSLTSRTAALPSMVNQLATGQDYYGNPLTPGGLLESNLPIPAVQILKTLQENPKTQAKDAQGHPIPGTGQPYQDWKTAALNTAGLRVHNDPNDPAVIAQNQYFQGLQKYNNQLKQTDANSAGLFMSLIHPTKQDAQGNLIVDPNTSLTDEKYRAFFDHPNLLQTEYQFQQSQPQHAPLWDQSLSDVKAYMAYGALSNSTTGNPGLAAQVRLQNPWIPKMQASMAQYGQMIAQQTGGTSSPTSLSPMQKLTPQMVQIVSAYTALPTGSPQRKQLLAQNPWLKDYWNANTTYYAQQPQSTAPQSGLNQFLQGAGIAPITTAQTGSSYSSYGGGGRKGYRPSHAMPRGLNPYSGLKGLNRYATMKIGHVKTAPAPKSKGIKVMATRIGVPAKQQVRVKLAKAPKQSSVHIKQFTPVSMGHMHRRM